MDTWVSFKFEILSNFCYAYRRLGRPQMFCTFLKNIPTYLPFVPWLQADIPNLTSIQPNLSSPATIQQTPTQTKSLLQFPWIYQNVYSDPNFKRGIQNAKGKEKSREITQEVVNYNPYAMNSLILTCENNQSAIGFPLKKSSIATKTPITTTPTCFLAFWFPFKNPASQQVLYQSTTTSTSFLAFHGGYLLV